MKSISVGLILVAAATAALGIAMFGFAHGDSAARTNRASSWDQASASEILDSRVSHWLGSAGSDRGGGTACLSCHTSAPMALAESSLDGQLRQVTPSAPERKLVDGVRARVRDWNEIIAGANAKPGDCAPYYPDQKAASLGTESVLNALILVDYDDTHAHGTLSPESRDALADMWKQQRPDGSWAWIEFGLEPWEKDAGYYGDCLAAVAAGMAGTDYVGRPDLAANFAALRRALSSQYPTRPLHDQVTCLWAADELNGVLINAERKSLVSHLLRIQHADGSWSLDDLGKRADGGAAWQSAAYYPQDSIGDGYATGLIVLAIERSGIAGSEPGLSRGIAWLEKNEQAGEWPADYINGAQDPATDPGMYMRDASAAFAVLALTSSRRDSRAN